MTDPKGVPAVAAAPARSQWTAVVVLLSALAGGFAGGVVVDRTLLMPKVAERPVRDSSWRSGSGSGRDSGWRSGGPRGGSRTDMRRRFSERMAKELDLTEAQRERMDTIYAHQYAEMDVVTKKMRPSIDSIMQRAQASVDSVLNAEQRAKLAELRKQRRRDRGPGGPGGPFGPGGPMGAPPGR